MRRDRTEITLINPRPSKPPSLWANMLTLVFLFGMIIGAKHVSDRWLSNTPQPEDEEKQIVLEDLESEQPLAESAAISIPETQAPLPTPGEPIQEAKIEEVKTEVLVNGVQETPPAEQVAPELAKQAVSTTVETKPETAQTEGFVKEAKKEEKIEEKRIGNKETRIKNKETKKTKKVAKKIVKPKTAPAYAQPDPYTNGGPMDLDHPQNRKKPAETDRPSSVQQVTATPPVPSDEREAFIPFESN